MGPSSTVATVLASHRTFLFSAMCDRTDSHSVYERPLADGLGDVLASASRSMGAAAALLDEPAPGEGWRFPCGRPVDLSPWHLVVWRWKLAVLPFLVLTGAACVKQIAPTYDVHLTVVLDFGHGTSEAQGTIKNIGDVPMNYQISLYGPPVWPGGRAWALDVWPGQTAVWAATFVPGQYRGEVADVFAWPANPDPVHADTVITGVVPADYGGPDTEIMGTVTNTGSAAAGYAVELQGHNGQISRGYISYLAPGQTAAWDGANFSGNPDVHWVRTTNWSPLPPGYPVP